MNLRRRFFVRPSTNASLADLADLKFTRSPSMLRAVEDTSIDGGHIDDHVSARLSLLSGLRPLAS